MDFDITFLLSNIIDARRNGDTEKLVHLIMRYFADFDQGVVYAPEGITNCLKDITATPKRTIERSLRSLQERMIFSKMDEFSLQMNDQFSRRASKPLQYKGPRVFFDQSEQELVVVLQTKRAEIWALRGKNKRRVKASEEGEETMNKLIVTLTRQLESKDQQIEALLKIISGGDQAKKMEAIEKLALVIPIRK